MAHDKNTVYTRLQRPLVDIPTIVNEFTFVDLKYLAQELVVETRAAKAAMEDMAKTTLAKFIAQNLDPHAALEKLYRGELHPSPSKARLAWQLNYLINALFESSPVTQPIVLPNSQS